MKDEKLLHTRHVYDLDMEFISTLLRGTRLVAASRLAATAQMMLTPFAAMCRSQNRLRSRTRASRTLLRGR